MAHVDPMMQAILKANHLSEETRLGYSKRLALIATAVRNKALQPVSTLHPQKSAEQDLQELHRNWHPENYNCSCPCCKLLNLKATKKASYAMYLEQYKRQCTK